jgi:hypothetical protein
MIRTTHATFDGEVLRLEDTAGLEVNQRYRITLEEEAAPREEQTVEERYSALLDIASDMGIDGFADKLKK